MKQIAYTIIFCFVFLSCNCADTDPTAIRYGIRLIDVDINPAEEQGPEENHIKRQIFETLFILDENGDVQQNLVQNWEILEKNKKYRFFLGDGILFHDGNKLSSYSVQYSFYHYRDNNDQSILSTLIDTIQIEDSLSFTITLTRPFAPFLYVLTSPYHLLISSEKSLNLQDPSYIPIGTGPYQLIEPTGNYIHLRRFAAYREQDNFSVRHIYFLCENGDKILEEKLKSGEIDILYLIRSNQIDRLKWQGKIDYHVQEPLSTVFIGFNNENKIFGNKNIRMAILNQLDIRRIVINLNRGNALVAAGPLPPTYGIPTERGNQRQDLNLAKQLISTSQVDSPLNLKFLFPHAAYSRKTILEILKSELKKINIEIDVIEFDSWQEHDSAIKTDSSQIFIDAYSAEVLGDPANFLYSLFYSDSEKNTLHYKNSEVDRLLEQAVQIEDKNGRNKIYAQILDHIRNDIPAIFLFHVKPHYAYRTEKIKKLVVDPYGIIQFHKSELN